MVATFQLYYVGNYTSLSRLVQTDATLLANNFYATLLRPFAHPAACCCMSSLHAVAKIASAWT